MNPAGVIRTALDTAANVYREQFDNATKHAVEIADVHTSEAWARLADQFARQEREVLEIIDAIDGARIRITGTVGSESRAYREV